MTKKQQRQRTNSKSRGTNTLRIIAGQWRGRRLSFPDQEGLRPTPDKVRETLFNWLQGAVEASHCLDLFTGSGALSLEALSRGAASATLIDSSPLVINQLRDNLQLLKAENAQLRQASAMNWLQQPTITAQHFDLVFMDPPFHKGMVESCSQLLEHSGILSNRAFIYIEAERELKPLPLPDNWVIRKQKDSGQVSSYLCQRSTSD
ncbi:MAG: 16S rRNA (guanine(966)-N(2))-methyltransferase RsmD [Motiliproteus sp.]